MADLCETGPKHSFTARHHLSFGFYRLAGAGGLKSRTLQDVLDARCAAGGLFSRINITSKPWCYHRKFCRMSQGWMSIHPLHAHISFAVQACSTTVAAKSTKAQARQSEIFETEREHTLCGLIRRGQLPHRFHLNCIRGPVNTRTPGGVHRSDTGALNQRDYSIMV